MIIEDRDNYKIDLSWYPVDINAKRKHFLQITAFKEKGGEWVTKTIRLNPDLTQKLFDYIKEYKESEGPGNEYTRPEGK